MPDDTVRVMTWNVWWRFGDRWRDRQAGIAATIAAHRPDIVGLQESWATRGTAQSEALARSFDMYSVEAGPSLPDLPVEPETADHAAVDLGLAVLSRWPIRHSWTHRLPSSRDVPPVALITVLDHPRGPLVVVCACAEHHAHLADDHLAQAHELGRIMAELATREGDHPVILVGDLNAGPDGPEVGALTAGLVDAWVAGGGSGTGVTLSSDVPFAPRGAVKQLDRRIDYVLFRPSSTGPAPTVHDVAVVDDRVDGLHPSDHYAVVADLVF